MAILILPDPSLTLFVSMGQFLAIPIATLSAVALQSESSWSTRATPCSDYWTFPEPRFANTGGDMGVVLAPSSASKTVKSTSKPIPDTASGSTNSRTTSTTRKYSHSRTSANLDLGSRWFSLLPANTCRAISMSPLVLRQRGALFEIQGAARRRGAIDRGSPFEGKATSRRCGDVCARMRSNPVG